MNRTDQGNPTTVTNLASMTNDFVGAAADHNAVTNIKRYGWLRFATPLTGEKFIITTSRSSPQMNARTITNVAVAASLTVDARVQIYGMTQDWDHTALTWNNQPTPLASDPTVAWRLRHDAAFTGTSASVSREITAVLDCGGALVYGLHIQAEYIGTVGTSSSVTFDPIIECYSTRTANSIAVTQRESLDDVRTLQLASAHNFAAGMPIRVVGVASDYNSATTNAIVFSVASVPTSTSLTYSASTLLTEALTASGGRVEYY